MKVYETCGCGATLLFNISDTYRGWADAHVASFREAHEPCRRPMVLPPDLFGGTPPPGDSE